MFKHVSQQVRTGPGSKLNSGASSLSICVLDELFRNTFMVDELNLLPMENHYGFAQLHDVM